MEQLLQKTTVEVRGPATSLMCLTSHSTLRCEKSLNVHPRNSFSCKLLWDESSLDEKKYGITQGVILSTDLT